VWLDALKGIAILAVVLDHAFIVGNYELWKHLYFHVSWFVFLAGVSNTYSARTRRLSGSRDFLALWWRRGASLLPPYIAASALAFFFVYLGRQPASAFVYDFSHFHTLPPLYFIALLLQLLTVFPIVFALWYRAGWTGRIIVAAVIVPVGAVFSQVITFPWVLGAHYLFGASFLYLFVFGIALEPWLTGNRLHPAIALICGLPLLAAAEWFNLKTGGMLMTHPPTNDQLAYALGGAGLAYAVCRRFIGSLPVRLLGSLGHRSLDVFAYHYLFIIPLLHFRHAPWTDRLPFVWGQVVLMAIAVPAAIAASILTGQVVNGLVPVLIHSLQPGLNSRRAARAPSPLVLRNH
jgi:peptidoglycan/LPS O-acetylase OafA/YrhL